MAPTRGTSRCILSCGSTGRHAVSGAHRSRGRVIGHTLPNVTPPHRLDRPHRAAAYRAVRRGPAAAGAVLVPAVAAAVAAGHGQTSTGDLVLPLVAVVAAVAVAAYASVRRRIRVTTRTTPGGAPTVVPLDELDRRARGLLVVTDDCVRTSRDELGWAAGQLGDAAVREYAEAVEFAASELAAAFRIRQRLDDGEGGRRVLLEEVAARCGAAGRRLDTEAAGFDQARALEQTVRDAVERAEARFREVAARVADADGTLAGLRAQYALAAYLPVAGHDEQARDRLVFATTCLNRARQAVDGDETAGAVVQLRAAEAAVGQAELLVTGIARLASALATATDHLPAALTDAETGLAQAREPLDTEAARADLRGRIAYGESVVAQVRKETGGEGAEEDTGTEEDTRAGAGGTDDAGTDDGVTAAAATGATEDRRTEEETRAGAGASEDGGTTAAGTGGRSDPVGALRRIEQVAVGLDRAVRHEADGPRVLRRLERAVLVARSTVGATADYVTAHRGAVGCEARTRLAEAERQLREAENTDAAPVPAPAEALADAREADALARQARQLAERDVRAYGTPYGDGLRTGGAVLGGILLNAPHRHGDPPGYPGDGGPASYGGPGTRGRRDGGGLFRPARGQGPPREEPRGAGPEPPARTG